MDDSAAQTAQTEKLLTLLTGGMPAIMEALAGPDGQLDAEELSNFFALGMAMVIENDPNLTTPRDIRQSAEDAGRQIANYVRYFRAIRQERGMGFLEAVMNSQPTVN